MGCSGHHEAAVWNNAGTIRFAAMTRLPHAIPYQGSKRKLAPLIASFYPSQIETHFEPFAGSAAMTIWAAKHGLAKRYVIADSLEALVEINRAIVFEPQTVATRYRELWQGQQSNDHSYFNRTRERYNDKGDPIDLLYLICRCVKNAIRFNSAGRFTQSVDKRRLGMKPDRMEAAVLGISQLLKDKVELRSGDWRETTNDALPGDFIYMDPPYLGTSVGRDKRYHQQLQQDQLIDGLRDLRSRSIRFALSYDGMTGTKEYGPPLPENLGLTRLLLGAGTSSQSTLSGKKEKTVESLYLTPGLSEPIDGVIERASSDQAELSLV